MRGSGGFVSAETVALLIYNVNTWVILVNLLTCFELNFALAENFREQGSYLQNNKLLLLFRISQLVFFVPKAIYLSHEKTKMNATELYRLS